MIISINAEKAFHKIQHPFRIKTLSKVGIEGTNLSIIKTTCDELTVSIVLNGQKLQVFPIRLGTRQGCLLSPLLFNMKATSCMATESPSHSNQRRRRNKRHQNWKGRSKEVKLSLLADDMILYIENPKVSTKKLLELTNDLSKVAGYKINIQKSVVFYIPKMNCQKGKLRKQSHLP